MVNNGIILKKDRESNFDTVASKKDVRQIPPPFTGIIDSVGYEDCGYNVGLVPQERYDKFLEKKLETAPEFNFAGDIDKNIKVIKDNFQITLPLRGTITSRFGDREIEPKFHTGIDIDKKNGKV